MQSFRLLFLLTVVGINCTYYASAQDDRYLIELPCDSSDAQIAMNQCAHQKSRLLDSIMISKYLSLLNSLDSDLEKYRNSTDVEMLQYTEDMRSKIVSSQNLWEQMCAENAQFYNVTYEGGSIRSFMISQSRIHDMIDRIDKLDLFRQEVGE